MHVYKLIYNISWCVCYRFYFGDSSTDENVFANFISSIKQKTDATFDGDKLAKVISYYIHVCDYIIYECMCVCVAI